MFLEPFFMLAPLGTMFIHQFPELLRVIHLFQVGKLMDDMNQKQKANLTVNDLIVAFERASGEEFDDDSILLHRD